MKTYFGSNTIDEHYPAAAVVAIGNFDGVHLGHQKILETAKIHAKRLGIETVVFTFNPHPTLQLRPQAALKLLMTYEEKRNQLNQLNVDFCVEESFDTAFSNTSAHDFFYEILKKRLHAQVIVVGADFSFGHKREGSTQLLEKYCAETGTEIFLMKPVMLGEASVSSSRIRDELSQGRLALAEALLGRAFFYRGEVVHGDKRGRTIGFPTANMNCEEKFPLLPGVYATSVLWQGKQYPSVTNIGTRPTFQKDSLAGTALIPLRIETHILDQNFDLYGEILEVRFYERIREEKKFNSVAELIEQITNDIVLARKLLRSRNF